VLAGSAGIARAQDCTTVRAVRSLAFRGAPWDIWADSGGVYGSAGCDRFVVDISSASDLSNISALLDTLTWSKLGESPAVCQSAQMMLTVWGRSSLQDPWQLVGDVTKQGAWVTQDFYGNPVTKPYCSFGTTSGPRGWGSPNAELVTKDTTWSLVRAAVGVKINGQPAGALTIWAY